MMKLVHEDYIFCKDVVDKALKLDIGESEEYILDIIKREFISDLDMSDFDNRHRVFLLLKHISSLFLNYWVNGAMYFLTEVEIEKAIQGSEIVARVVKTFRERGVSYLFI
jgi:hypothetical protein